MPFVSNLVRLVDLIRLAPVLQSSLGGLGLECVLLLKALTLAWCARTGALLTVAIQGTVKAGPGLAPDVELIGCR
jgi:hypothetical protein